MELDAILDNLSDEEQIELLELLEEEENYRNTHLLNTSLANTTPVNVLNVATATANVFWADDSIRLLSQPIPVSKPYACW